MNNPEYRQHCAIQSGQSRNTNNIRLSRVDNAETQAALRYTEWIIQ